LADPDIIMATEIGQHQTQQIARATRAVDLPRGVRLGQRLPAFLAVVPLPFLDAAAVGASMAAAYLLRFRLMAYLAPLSTGFYLHLVAVAIPLWLFIFVLYRLYHPDYLWGGLQEYASIVHACTGGIVGLVIYSFLNRQIEQEISRGWLAFVWVFSIISVTGTRFLYRRLIYGLRQRGMFVRRALIVGANEEGQIVAAQLRGAATAGVMVAGFVDPVVPAGTQVEGLTVLGGPERLEHWVKQTGAEVLIVVPTALRREALLDLYRDWGTNRRVHLHLSSGLYELLTTGAQVHEVGFVPLIRLNRTRITGMDALMKAALDLVGASLGVVLLTPLFLLIALLIRLDSPGPVIHRRRVVGLHGRPFDAFKFRTMIADADAYLEAHPELKEEWERTGKIRDDPRITRIGRFLRRTSLDELPQLFNVLLGQMSLVGPRMITPGELEHFGRWQHNLLMVKPGMTGLWQVSGRAELSYEERVRLDMHYIRNYTIWLDLKVLLNTFWVVLQGRGAF
jgi:exopolysaccharide biosynthesis polyprenyl glycosylphosphotransferase